MTYINQLAGLWRQSQGVRVIVLVALMVGMVALIAQKAPLASLKNSLSYVGGQDIATYWSAYQAIKANKNPYLISDIAAFQRPVIKPGKDVAPFLNTPLSLAILSPVLVLGFAEMRWLWLIFNVFFLVASVFLVRRYLGMQMPGVSVSVLSAVLFIPALWAVMLGQLDLFMTFSLTAGMAALLARRDIIAGFIFVPLVLKPHLLLLVALLLLVYMLWNRRLLVLMGFVVGIVLAALVAYLLSPQIFSFWAYTDSQALEYKTSSLVTIVQETMLLASGRLVAWPGWLVPIAGIIIALPYFILRCRDKPLELLLPSVLCVSLGIAPYAWLHDFALLIVCQITLIVRVMGEQVSRSARFEIFFWLVAIQIAIVVSAIFNSYPYFFWIPWGMLAVWIRAAKLQVLSAA